MNYRKVPFGDLATNTAKLKKLYTEDLQLDIRNGCVAVYTGEKVNCIDELTDDRIVFYKQGYVDEKGVWQNKDEDLHTAKLLYEVNRFIRVLFVENERLKSERDKAVGDLENLIDCHCACNYCANLMPDGACEAERKYGACTCLPKWRGL